MRKARPILLALILCASTVHASGVPESQVLGTWIGLQRSPTALGTMWTFQSGGKLEMSLGTIYERWYRLDGDKLIEPPNSSAPGAKPVVSRIRIEGNTLHRQTPPNPEVKMTRVGSAVAGAPPIVGAWHIESHVTPATILEQQKNAGQPVDAQTAAAMAAVLNQQVLEYTRDGLLKFRLAMRTTPGTYDLGTQTFTMSGVNGRFRIQNGILFMTQPDGKMEAAYVRANATKEQLKRAGVHYGDEPAELDPPAH